MGVDNSFMHRLAAIALVSLLFTGSAQAAPWSGLRLGSAHAIVVDEATGEVLLEKDGSTAAPIASLTKLMTAMVVLDAQQDPNEELRISEADLDTLKHTRSGVRVGTAVSRAALLELALIASDNHAASALARHYPGGMSAFLAAVRQKVHSLGLSSTLIEEPTGLSPNNRSSALDMVKVVRAAGSYPVITELTSKRHHAVVVEGHVWAVKNTNRLVGAPGWNILTSKTGFTNEAGRCVSMRLQAAGRTVSVVLMGAMGSSERALDALNIRRWLAGEPPVAVQAAAKGARRQAVQRKQAGLAKASAPAHAGAARVIDRTAPGITIRESVAELGD
jgi:D-alanyl-D-alanine carboxypeptidase/D-alanyl-D-alanine endopeptidase (penicillin-binding protein 7)